MRCGYLSQGNKKKALKQWLLCCERKSKKQTQLKWLSLEVGHERKRKVGQGAVDGVLHLGAGMFSSRNKWSAQSTERYEERYL